MNQLMKGFLRMVIDDKMSTADRSYTTAGSTDGFDEVADS